NALRQFCFVETVDGLLAHAIDFRGGDALQRMPPSETPGVMLLNPPYGERIPAAGGAGGGREGFVPGRLAAARARLGAAGRAGGTVLGACLALAGILVLTGLDKRLEAWVLDVSPDWLVRLSTAL
ncbi:MAG: hypothetical protein ACO3CS_16960, partial [Alphaproteobacteria bacterium]